MSVLLRLRPVADRRRPARSPFWILDSGFWILLTFLVSSCSPVAHQPLRAATPVPTATARPIQLPGDDAPHADLTEWWYYTGHLATPAGQKYGFELVIFQIERQGAPIQYFAHVAVTDHQRQEFHFDQQAWQRDRAPATFDLGNDAVQMRGDGTSDLLKATLPGYGLDLRVTPTKPPALHGGGGVISFGPVGDSYYYSQTRLEISGTISDHGSSQAVSGLAWKDRQWGNFLVLPSGGWDWYSLQLDDGTDLMLFVLRDAKGTSPAYGTLVSPDGEAQALPSSAATVEPTGRWASPHSGATYPSGWMVGLPDHGLSLSLAPILRDQELDTRGSTGSIYWEGEVAVTGTSGGRPIAGTGYVELTGYATKNGAP
jgi:predicted secreted hydrolase